MFGKVSEKEVFLLRWSKAGLATVVRWAVRGRWAVVGVAVAAFVGSLFVFTRLGQEFVPQLMKATSPCTRCASPAPG